MRTLVLTMLCCTISQKGYPLTVENSSLKLPTSSVRPLQEILEDERTVFYKLPQVWQQWIPGQPSLVLPVEVMSEHNANLEFPWETTVGFNIEHQKGSSEEINGAINFHRTPSKYKPIVVVTGEKDVWIYPLGMVVGELLWVRDGNIRRTIEVRTRTKINHPTEGITWDVRRYAPIRDVECLRSYLILQYRYTRKNYSLKNPEPDDLVFEMKGNLEVMQNLHPDNVRYLLDQKFVDCTGFPWSDGCSIPASNQDFHIFPRNYVLGLLESVDNITCSGCHKKTQISVKRLIPNFLEEKKPLLKNLGAIRGSDGIFTWHPYEVSNPKKLKRRNWRRYDLENNIVQEYNQAIHKDYKITKYVQESLAEWELPIPEELLNN